MKGFIEGAAANTHPLRVLTEFLNNEDTLYNAKAYDQMKFVGYVLDIGYDLITITTTDYSKIHVGGIPRNSMLIMCPDSYDDETNGQLPPHFTLLRVLDSAPTPLSRDDQQTFFELHKRSMPELDVFTSNELQWGALKTDVLGMFYINPDNTSKVEFSGDLNNYVSAHKYKVYAPNDELLDLVNNSIVPQDNRFKIGELRLTECRLPLPKKKQPKVDIILSTKDFMGCRTAMFGKTRLGKSNVVKLITQSLLETTKEDKNVGQLIFDINGEYANDNPQNISIKSSYPDQCVVYALTPKKATPSKPLNVNFYFPPNSSKEVLNSLIRQSGRATSDYIKAFLSTELPSIDVINAIPNTRDKLSEKNRAIRKIQYYIALLSKAKFEVNENQLRGLLPRAVHVKEFNPSFTKKLREAAYEFADIDLADPPIDLNSLVRELEVIIRFKRAKPNDPNLTTSSGSPLFDQEDMSILEILEPQIGRSGVTILLPYKIYHNKDAGNYSKEILKLLDEGMTVILDLGNANEEVMQYFSRQLSEAVFYHQTDKFTNDELGNHFVQIYFEEAHNLFGFNDNSDNTKIYRRFAKEGAKYHIGMVYSTQSPSTVNPDLLAQTENFFILHLSSRDDVNRLAKLNVAYDSIKEDILMAKTVGFVRMLTRSHRFVVSMQALPFEPPKVEV